jgi:hypothetical protein
MGVLNSDLDVTLRLEDLYDIWLPHEMWGRVDYALHDLVHKIQQIELSQNDIRTIFEIISQTIDQHMGRHFALTRRQAYYSRIINQIVPVWEMSLHDAVKSNELYATIYIRSHGCS